MKVRKLKTGNEEDHLTHWFLEAFVLGMGKFISTNRQKKADFQILHFCCNISFHGENFDAAMEKIRKS